MDLSVRNANYERVMAVMDKFLKERYSNICCCPRCVNDIAAIALNYLPPHYFVDTNEEKEIGSPWVMVETAVVEAIDRVSENPNHTHQHTPHVHSADSPALMS
jgi:competence protein ComFB